MSRIRRRPSEPCGVADAQTSLLNEPFDEPCILFSSPQNTHTGSAQSMLKCNQERSAATFPPAASTRKDSGFASYTRRR